jgi:hypothetical protein
MDVIGGLQQIQRDLGKIQSIIKIKNDEWTCVDGGELWM